MDHRDDWIRELERRQDNIDPIRRIPNSALFNGTLIKGNLKLNRVQRAGAVFLGLVNIAVGVTAIANAVGDFRAGRGIDFPILVFCPLPLWFGWRMTKNAFVNSPYKRS